MRHKPRSQPYGRPRGSGSFRDPPTSGPRADNRVDERLAIGVITARGECRGGGRVARIEVAEGSPKEPDRCADRSVADAARDDVTRRGKPTHGELPRRGALPEANEPRGAFAKELGGHPRRD